MSTGKSSERRQTSVKIEISFLAALLLVGTDLLARAAAQGVEQALFSTAIEYAMNGFKATRKILPNSMRQIAVSD